jgi:hypothetical protein
MTAAVLVVLAAPTTFVATAIQRTVIVITVVSAEDRSSAVSATLVAVKAGTTEGNRPLSINTLRANKPN